MSCYYTGAQNNQKCYSIGDKDNTIPDREVIENTIDEIVQMYGQRVSYYVNTYNTLSADNIYGEQPTSIFHPPKIFKMYVKLNEDALKLTKFGFDPEDDITAYVTFTSFASAFSGDNIFTTLNDAVEPKSGDVFQMVEFGSDRRGNRAGNYFQVTERTDQDIAELNPLGGHYMWRIKAKRLDFSYQPGLSGETGNQQVYDDSFEGKLTSTITGEVSSSPKTYTGSADEESVNQVYDQSVNNTDIYGEY